MSHDDWASSWGSPSPLRVQFHNPHELSPGDVVTVAKWWVTVTTAVALRADPIASRCDNLRGGLSSPGFLSPAEGFLLTHMVSFLIRTHAGEAADEPAWRERTDPRGDCSNLINRGVRLSQ